MSSTVASTRAATRTGALLMALVAALVATVVVAEPVVRAPEAQASIIDPGPPPPACKESYYRSSSWPNIVDVRNEADPTRRCYWDRTWTGRGALVELSGAPGEMKDGQTVDVSPRWSAFDPAAPNWTPPTDGVAPRASFRLRFNRSPEFPYDYNPFLRSADGRYANPTVGYDDVFAIPPSWDMSGCEEPQTTTYRWYTDSCQIRLVKGPYYDVAPGELVPWMVFTAAYMQNYDSAGFDTPMMTDCFVTCPGPPRWWGQTGYIEMPVFIHPSPYARVTSSHVQGRTFAFDGTGTLYNGTIERYDWDFGDGTTATGPTPQHTYATEGTYTARLTVTADGQSSTTSTTVVAERTVALDLRISVSNREPAVDDSITVSYQLTNTGDTNVTNVSVDYSFDPDAAWTGLSPNNVTLAPGASRTLTQTVFVREIPFTINATASGQTTTEQVRSLPRSMRIGEANALDVWLDVNPTEVNLDPDGDANLEPQPVTATVYVSNTGAGTLHDVDVSGQLISTDTPAPVEVSGTMPNMDIESLSGFETRQFTVNLSAKEFGGSTFRVDATVLSGNGAGMNDTDSRDINVTGLADVSFTWKMPERYGKFSDGALDSSKGNPANWTVLLNYKVKGLCPTTGTRVWKLNGQAVTPTVVDPAKPCELKLVRPNLEQFNLSLQAKSPGGASLGTAQQDIQPRDLVIVSLGDSMSSGEGVPQRSGRQWENDPCHRSGESGMAQAARKIENDNNPDTHDDEHSSVTFVHLACSGASTRHLMDNSFAGVTGGGHENPQLFQLHSIIGDREVDVVLMTAGINDIRFGDVLKHCLAYLECERVQFEGKSLIQFLNDGIAALDESYDRLDQYLEALQIPSSKVRLIEYPDPSVGSGGETCGYLGITAQEMAFLKEHLLNPLNAAGESGAAAAGWTRIGGVASQFQFHGLCAGHDSWMVGIFESLAKQRSPAGGFHPNYDGHAVIAETVLPSIPTDGGLGGRVGPASFPQVGSFTKRGTRVMTIDSLDPLPVGTKVSVGSGRASQETRTITKSVAGKVVGSEAVAEAVDDGTLDPVEEGTAGPVSAEAATEVAAPEAAFRYTITLDKPLLYDHGVDEMVMEVADLSPQARQGQIFVSDGPNRFTGVRPLYGEALTSPKSIWFDPGAGVTPTQVQFLVDGKVFSVDRTAPYDMVAGQTLTVTGFDPSVLANGTHQVEAKALNASGAVLSSDSVPITVNNASVRTIRWSTKIARTPASELEGARVLAGPAFVFLGPTATAAIKGLGPLEWVLDGTVIDRDPAGPYDLGDGGSATRGVAMPATARRAGNHTLVVRLKLPSGQLHEIARATYRAG